MGYDINIRTTEASRLSDTDFSNLAFGKIFTDHMFVADHHDGAWTNARIEPTGPLPMHPATSSLHYGQAIFEGLKAYRNVEGEIVIFRPEMNWKRMNKSADRMAMPSIPYDLFMGSVERLIDLDRDWVPDSPDASLYIRPFMIATDEFIGVRTSQNYSFIILLCPVGAYYAKPVKVYASSTYTRAFPGGTGAAKVAGNYAATLKPANLIHQKGYDQILWLDGIEHRYLQEIGTMNVFVVIDGKVITPTIDEGTILEGVTRDSAIQLLKEWDIPFEARRIKIDEVIEASRLGTLQEMFGTGTAATVSHITHVGYQGREHFVSNPDDQAIALRLKEAMQRIKLGQDPDPRGWIHTLGG